MAAPRSIATWVSWPHACITPFRFDLNSTSTFSWSGSASMSALRATTLPFFPVLRTPTTPVPPTRVFTSMPRALSSRATRAPVAVSW